MSALGAVGLLAVGCLGSAAVGSRTAALRLLTGYVFVVADIVLTLELLSLFHGATTTNFGICQCVLAGAAMIAFVVTRRQRRPPLVAAMNLRVLLASDRVLAALAAAVAVALAYELALAVLTPPNNWDSMTYHLSRAAGWYQRHAVGYLDAHTQRENANPPNAEILILASFLLVHGDRLAAVWQWFAEIASLSAIYAIGLRLGFERKAALFAALLFATMTQVALQASSTQNDLLTASLVVAAVAFLCAGDRAGLVLSATAIGLAVGTKLTALFALPAFALIAFVLVPMRSRIRVAALSFGGIVVFGSYGYVLNLIHSGSLLGWRDDTGVAAHSLAGRMAAAILAPLATLADVVGANEDTSYMGLAGGLVIVPVVCMTLFKVRGRRASPLALALAAAFPAYVLAMAAVYRFNPWVGRFMLTPVALAMPLGATFYRWRRYRAVLAAAAVASLASVLVFDAAKPSGVRGPGIWSMSRPNAEATMRPAMRPVLNAIADCVPATARVGYVLGTDDWDYPLYGPSLSRELVKLRPPATFRQAGADGLDWLLVRRGLVRSVPPPGWQAIRFSQSGLALLRRSRTLQNASSVRCVSARQ